MRNLIVRSVSGSAYIAIVLIALFFNQFSLLVLLLLINTLCIYEFMKLMDPNIPLGKIIFTVIICDLIIIAFFSFMMKIFKGELLLLIPALIFSFFVIELFSKRKILLRIDTFFTSMIYVTLPLILLIYISLLNGHYNPISVFAIFLFTWVNDTFAFLIGSQTGKTPLYKNISPNKTWEGLIGGIAFTLLAGFIFSNFHSEFTTMGWTIFALIVAVSGVIGDLTESMFKRLAGKKDSGKIFPGHGGALDRFDSFLFSSVFVSTYIIINNLV